MSLSVFIGVPLPGLLGVQFVAFGIKYGGWRAGLFPRGLPFLVSTIVTGWLTARWRRIDSFRQDLPAELLLIRFDLGFPARGEA